MKIDTRNQTREQRAEWKERKPLFLTKLHHTGFYFSLDTQTGTLLCMKTKSRLIRICMSPNVLYLKRNENPNDYHHKKG
jgi:hypothetical protein